MATTLLFPGQGAQVVGMGRSFFENSEQTRKLFTIANDILGFNLSDLCFNGPEDQLKETAICQPALYVVGYAIFAELKKSGAIDDIKCAAGLSLGELTALAVADVFDFETGLKIVAERSKLMNIACNENKTGMVSLIGGSLKLAQKLAEDLDIDISNLNCPGQIVVAGTLDKMELVPSEAKKLGFKMTVPLKVAGAYHSRWMKTAAEKFGKFLSTIKFNEPKLLVPSNTIAKPINNPNDVKTSLVTQITATVMWEQSMCWLIDNNLNNCIECGPSGVLAGLAKRTNKILCVSQISEYDDILKESFL